MFNPTKFQQIDSYVSALCIGALVSLSFWFVIIGSLLGIVFLASRKRRTNLSIRCITYSPEHMTPFILIPDCPDPSFPNQPLPLAAT